MTPLLQLLAPVRAGLFLADVRGSVLPITAVALTAALATAGVAADVGRVYALQNVLSTAADAAALAAASRLPDAERARDAALDYAARNMPSAEYGEVLVERDVELGTFAPETAASARTVPTRTPSGSRCASHGRAATRRPCSSPPSSGSTRSSWPRAPSPAVVPKPASRPCRRPPTRPCASTRTPP